MEKNIIRFYNEITENLEGNYKIILEPNRSLVYDYDWIEYDKVKWELENGIQNLVEYLNNQDTLNIEEKILEVYKFICLNYVYDDNVLYFFKQDKTDPNNIKYIAVDWYGRIVDEKWRENRLPHNRRICYEFARFYAKAINDLLPKNSDLTAVMVGDTENLHYVVGLTGNDYSIILDLDDFNKIKDLTRLKLGLSIKGINILRDTSGKFKTAVNNFNKNKPDELPEVEKIIANFQGNNKINFFNNIIDILKQYNLDSQGFCEYMRSKIENAEIEIEKIWKEVKGAKEKRYSRCLIFNFNSKTYLLDSVLQSLYEVDLKKIDKEIFIFNPENNVYPYYGG